MKRLLLIVPIFLFFGCPKDECSSNGDCDANSACVQGSCQLIVSNNVNNTNNANNVNNSNNSNNMSCNCVAPLQCDDAGGCVECLIDGDCPNNSVCDGGSCVCETGTHDCEGTCVFDDQLETCGDRCEPCDVPQNGVATCDSTMCGVACDTGFVFCENCTEVCSECNIGGTECDDPTASLCDDGTCVPCVADADCSGIAGAGICDAGACVECTVNDETACNGNSCDPATGSCTNTTLLSVGVCEGCLADSECEAGLLCVPMDFQGATRPTGYCLMTADVACPAPYGIVLGNRTSLSGTGGDFCGIREDMTTCEAVLAYGSPCAQAGDCTSTGLNDARCEPIEFGGAACSFSCDFNDADNCPDPFYGCSFGWCGGY